MASTTSRVERPNFERSPPEASQRPEPLEASFTRMPMRGRTPIFLAVVGDELELGELLDHDDDLAPQLRGHQRGLDVLLVLVAVADDERLLVVQERHHRQQLGLGAGLEAVVVGPAELDDLLHHVAVLVDLDRVDAAVVALVAELGDGPPEGLVQLDHPALEDVGEADEQRQADATARDLVDQLLEVDVSRLRARADARRRGPCSLMEK